ncbi:hypothetical protein [Elizabethkingia anophelis]|uniref:hypothetical protein n=1 Tax=Elizabethkingia anophelis TaxID=1117645 RepID=UPI00038A1D44|nr:hypothetical protein [Elizabethkingia anophelis]EQB90578.1 hypothetical protein C874_16400 [Elizabethkingia anophelis 502]MCL1690470.1 hypothetical protein [Elizabethkingia anophelis]OPC33062.1 hypothetical protein BAX98_04265 [Elizabethkingia anophelis]
MSQGKIKTTYSILSEILKLKFNKQLKDSGIEFHNIYRVTNLGNGKENYLLTVNDVEIRFVTPRDFILHFIRFLCSNIEQQQANYEYLINIEINDFTDEVEVERKYKEASHFIHKQTELLKLMNDYKLKII